MIAASRSHHGAAAHARLLVSVAADPLRVCVMLDPGGQGLAPWVERVKEARLARDVLDAAAPRAASAGKALHNSPSGSTLDTESSGRISLEMGAAARQWP